MEKISTFLEPRKVEVKMVDKYRSGFKKDHDGSSMYTGCKIMYQCPTNQYDRLIPILTEEEQRFFEDRMGLERNSMSFNNRLAKNNFWRDFRVALDKKGRVLDLNDAEDNIAWRVLKASNTVANSQDEINVLQHSFYMVTDSEKDEVNMKMANKYEEASKLFASISKSDNKMINVLRVLGKQVPAESPTKWLKAELVKVIEQKAKTPGTITTDDFIRVAGDPNIDTRIFILDAMETGEVYSEGATYKLRSGDVIGYDFEQTMTYFNNPKNQQIKLLIMDRIKNSK
jgi:hypothetical protein